MKIKALLVMPGMETQVVKIPTSLKFIRAFIGKDLFKIELTNKTYILANRKANVSEFNRIYKGDIILGAFVIVSTKKGHLTSMNKKSIRQYSNMFRLKKHQRKIEKYKNEFLEEYYSSKFQKQEAVIEEQKLESKMAA